MEHIMKTLYEVLNVDLSQQYTKERKLSVLSTMGLDSDLMLEVEDAVAEMDIPEDDDRYHWIQIFGRQSGADLLTIGKVQPENMLAMAGLGADDFKEAVKVATSFARSLNTQTIEAEKELNTNTIDEAIV
jgi:hypothetical protein|tara:strand:- start:2209 stop:2598 length:390 start_codon:yes stop_codon:yes gene_type:complete